jgi:hypothetical protein
MSQSPSQWKWCLNIGDAGRRVPQFDQKYFAAFPKLEWSMSVTCTRTLILPTEVAEYGMSAVASKLLAHREPHAAVCVQSSFQMRQTAARSRQSTQSTKWILSLYLPVAPFIDSHLHGIGYTILLFAESREGTKGHSSATRSLMITRFAQVDWR